MTNIIEILAPQNATRMTDFMSTFPNGIVNKLK